ncbi:hypothetical protein [Streptomyces sp. NPDC055749]
MTPYSLAFYMDVVTNGTVLGLRPTDSPDRVSAVLGDKFGENSFDSLSLHRDYGLTEFYWHRASADQPWTGHHFSLQVHRLARRDRTIPDQALRARYGRFTPRLRFEKLQRLLQRRGVPLQEIPELTGNAPHYRTFWQPHSHVAVSIISMHGEYSTPGLLQVGDVYKIEAPVSAEEVGRRRRGSFGRG